MEMFLRHIARVQRMLRRRGRTAEEAEDIIHETLLRVQAYVDRGGQIREPEAFLVTAALNLSADMHDHERRHLYVRHSVEELPIADPSPGPDEQLALEQCLKRMNAVLDAGNPRTRDIFLMHRVHGLSYLQIAAHFEISVSSVEKHIAKAMVLLGRELVHP